MTTKKYLGKDRNIKNNQPSYLENDEYTSRKNYLKTKNNELFKDVNPNSFLNISKKCCDKTQPFYDKINLILLKKIEKKYNLKSLHLYIKSKYYTIDDCLINNNYEYDFNECINNILKFYFNVPFTGNINQYFNNILNNINVIYNHFPIYKQNIKYDMVVCSYCKGDGFIFDELDNEMYECEKCDTIGTHLYESDSYDDSDNESYSSSSSETSSEISDNDYIEDIK